MAGKRVLSAIVSEELRRVVPRRALCAHLAATRATRPITSQLERDFYGPDPRFGQLSCNFA